MTNINKVIFCALFIICLIDVGYGLSCISCSSDDILSECREGRRAHITKVKACEGRKARCYAMATVTDAGKALFERGCSKIGFCVSNDDDLEFCNTCGHKNCNFAFMDLAREVEEYLLAKREKSEDEDASTEY